MNGYDDNRLRAISIIESLRSGVPSRILTRELPDLRPQVLDLIRNDLTHLQNDEIPSGRLIWAQYGQGKSHFLRMVEHLALEKNFAVSYITLNRQVSLNNLSKFFQVAAPFVKVPNSNIPGLMNKLLKAKHNDLPQTHIQFPSRYPHPLPAAVLECLLHTSDDDFNRLYHHLMGDFMPIAEVRRLASDVGLIDLFAGMERFKQAHITASFGVLSDITRFCGYKGWVILIDEAELVGRLGRMSRLSAYRNLIWLLNWNNGRPYPIYTIAAVASSLQELWYTKNHKEGDRDAVPRIAGERLGAEVKNELEDFFERAIKDECPKLVPINDNEINPLLSKIGELYCKAYGQSDNPDPIWIEQTLRSATGKPIRTYIKAALEILDNYFLTGGISEVKTEELSEHPMVKD